MLNKAKKLFNRLTTIYLLTTLSLLLSLQKFNHCVKYQWSTAFAYKNGCYSDIPPLFIKYHFYQHIFPYDHGENSFEYPTGMALITHLLSYVNTGAKHVLSSYFYTTLIFLSLAFILSVFVIQKSSSSSPLLFVLAPATLFSLFINWDLAAILPLLTSLYLFKRGNFTLSSLSLSLATSIKFIPVFILLPINYIFFRDKKYKQALKFNLFFTLSWLVVNLPFALLYPKGFTHFYIFNLHRSADWGSYWYASYLLNPVNPKLIANVITVLSLTLFSYVAFRMRKTLDLNFLSLLVIGFVTTLAQVYSPQYTIWLSALTALVPGVRKVLIPFISWQTAELIYNLAIWSRLTNTLEPSSGITESTYALTIILRVLLFLYFIFSLYLSKRKEQDPENQD